VSDHAKLSPSSSDRWLACPASIARAPDVEDEGSEYAREGTAAHALAEHCLKNKVLAHAAVFPADHAKYDSPEMRMHVQGYLEYVERQMVPGAELFIEQKLTIFAEFDVWGTADAVIVTPDGTVKIIDLKYGQGLVVEADSPQLIMYAIGGLSFDWLSRVPVHTVEAHIYQPRRNNFPSLSHPVEHLITWIGDHTSAVAEAFLHVDRAHPGTHCKYCPIKGTCRERAEYNLSLAKFDFGDFEPSCAHYEGMTQEELVKVFLNIKQVRDYLDDVEAEVARQAHAGPVPGVKWVAGRVSRVIVDEAAAIAALQRLGITPFKEPALIGITEIEKQVKAKGSTVSAELGAAVSVVAGKPALVPETDKRDAISPEAAAVADFK
jgi:hypothetical protein